MEQPVMIPAGSHAARKVVEKYQSLFGLHSHIHESKDTTMIGRTLCVNPGSEYAEGILTAWSWTSKKEKSQDMCCPKVELT